MRLRLDLLRHGATERGQGFRGSLDDPLTGIGWQQMEAAVAGAGPWDRIVSSPLIRCARFAERLAASAGLPLTYEAQLQELHFGEWEGRTALELMADHEADLGSFWNDPYAFTPPGGEPVAAFARRVNAAIARLAAAYAGERLLLIVHGGVIKLLMAQARQLPREQLLQVAVAHGDLLSLCVRDDGSLVEEGG